MKLSKEEYKEAKNCLKRYNYNCITMLNIRNDFMSINAVNYDGMPKAKYNVSDSVANSVIKLQEDKYLQQIAKEYKAVVQAVQLVNKDSKYIFEELYVKGNSRWNILSSGMSEATFKRRKRALIYAVNSELKKMSQN